MILKIDNPLLAIPVFEFADKIPGVSPEVFRKSIIENVANKDTLLIVEKKDNEVRGFLFCTIEQMQFQDAIFIQYAYVKPNAYLIGHELLNRVLKWKKERNIDKIYMMTSRNPEAFEKKYKFKLVRYLMERGN